MIMTCGFSFHDFIDEAFSDVWRYEFARSQWIPVVAAGGPVAGRLEPAVVADCFHDRLVMFGGFLARSEGDLYFRDLWQLPLTGTGSWTPLDAVGDPPVARWGQSAIFDPLSRRMVIFGGRDSLGEYSQAVTLLELADAPRWVSLNPGGGAPPPRAFHTAVYDALRNEMLVFGGLGPMGSLGDVWALSLGGQPKWTRLEPTGNAPVPRFRHCAAFDPDHDLMVMQGGYDGHGDVFFEFGDGATLSLREGPVWARALAAPDDPLWRNGSAMTPDPLRGELVLYGGLGTGEPEGDLWRYEPVVEVGSLRSAWLLGVDGGAGRPAISWYAPGLQGLPAGIEESVDDSAWIQAAIVIVDPEGVITFSAPVQQPAHTYRYRLRFAGEIDPGVLELPVSFGDQPFLYPAQPNPTRASFDVRFLLPSSDAARLDLYDIQGRSVFHREVGDLGAGVHRLTVTGLQLPPGIYLIRLASSASVSLARVAILR